MNGEDIGLNDADLYRVIIMDLAAHLPEYDIRAASYLNDMLNESPSILMIQGVRKDRPGIRRRLESEGYDVHWSGRDTSYVFGGNITAVLRDLEVIGRDEIAMSSTDKQGNLIDVAPDCLVDVLNIGGHQTFFYNFESVRGAFFEAHRVSMASKIITYAYKYKRDGDKDMLMYMGGDLHADPDCQSVRLLCGKEVAVGIPPSAWNDVWGVMKASSDPDDGVTERQRQVFSSSVKIPTLVRPRRHTYFMAYDDVFGKAGTPINISINGNESTEREGIPYSDDYGLTMDLYIPPTAAYRNENEDE